MGSTYSTTRGSLHGCAELLLAGPRYRATGRLRLRVGPRGFGTWDEPDVVQTAGHLVTDRGRVSLDGLSFDRAARLAGLEASRLDDVYGDGPKVDPAEVIALDADAVRTVEDALALGAQALTRYRPAAEPVLWPEHFDVAISVDGVNYGVSPGDTHSAAPYAYVGPPSPVTGDFWNTAFGAARPLSDLHDVAGTVAFFREGARLLAS
jgi:hypothetical protein